MSERPDIHNHHLDQVAAGILDYKTPQDIVSWTEGLAAKEKITAVYKAMQLGANRGDTTIRLFVIAYTLDALSDKKINTLIRDVFVRELQAIVASKQDVNRRINECAEEILHLNPDYYAQLMDSHEVSTFFNKDI